MTEKKNKAERKNPGRRKEDTNNHSIINIEKQRVSLTFRTIVGIILFMVGVVGYILGKEAKIERSFVRIETRIGALELCQSGIKDDVEVIKAENVTSKVEFAIIKTKLQDIEVLLMEIKKDIRRKK